MSTSLSPRSTLAVHPTRQQLDELDALLQRMMDLPVNQVEEAVEEEAEALPPPPPPRPTRETSRPAVSYTVPVVKSAPRVQPPPPPPEPAPEPEMRFEPARFAPPVNLEPRIISDYEDEQEEEVEQAPEEESWYEAEPEPAPLPPPPAPPPPAPLPPPVAKAPVEPEPGPDDWVRLASSWQPSAQTWQPLAESWQQAQPQAPRSLPPAPAPAQFAPPPPPPAPEPEPEPEPMIAAEIEIPSELNFIAAPVPAPVEPEAVVEEEIVEDESEPESIRQESGPQISWFLWPLVPINVVFDVTLLLFGPLGGWLRSRSGRNVLGVLGFIALLAAVGLFLLDWFGCPW